VIHTVETTPIDREHYRDRELAMIFENFDDRSLEFVPKARALLVVVTKREMGVILARIEHPLLFEWVPGGTNPVNMCSSLAESLPRNQTWCVG